MRLPPHLLGLALALASLLVAPVVHADATADAKAHFKRGSDLYRQARYADAIGAFEAAYEARPSGVLHFNIAQCHEKLGDIPNALRRYHLYLRETPKADDRATVETAIANLEKRLAERGLQQLLVYSSPLGATVTVDGKARGTAPVSLELPPGPHDVGVALSGHQTATRRVTIAADKSLELDFTLVKATAAPVVMTEPAPAATKPPDAPLAAKPPDLTPKPADTTSTLPPAVVAPAETEHTRLFTWIAAGTAGAALAGAVVMGIAANADANTLRNGERHEQKQAQKLHDGAENKALAANVLYGAAGVAGVAAVTLFFVEGSF